MSNTPELALNLIREAKETNATSLDLGRCGLYEWPKELCELEQLEELTLSNRVWDVKERKWIESENSGPYNLLREIPKEISQLTHLKKLRIGGSGTIYGLALRVFMDEWKLADIHYLSGVPSLELLDLTWTAVEDISVLQHLSQLQSLDLSETNIQDISVLQHLSQLQSLYLSYNKQLTGYLCPTTPRSITILRPPRD